MDKSQTDRTPVSSRPFSHGVSFVNRAQECGWDEAAAEIGLGPDEAREWRRWYEREVCTPWVLRETIGGVEEVAAIPGAAPDVADLPLVVSSVDAVSFHDRVYPLAHDGLYRFITMTRDVRNLIVARDDPLLPVLRALAGLQIHGYDDNRKSTEELERMLPTCSFVCITCGTIASVAARVLTGLGFRTRSVRALTTDTATWNTYDNGHALFEVFWPRQGRWILADVDMGFLFKNATGYLDTGEVWRCLKEDERIELEPLANTLVDPMFVSPAGFNWFLKFRWKWQDEQGKMAWYRRILQAVGITKGDGCLYLGTPDRVNAYTGADPSQVLPYAQWRREIYGEA